MVRTRSGRHTTPKKKKEEKSRNQDVAEDDDWEALCEDGNSANLAIGGVTPCRWARWECLTCDLRQVGEGGLTFEEHCKTDFHRTNECRRLLQLHKTALFRPRGGLEVTLSSGGSDPSDPIKTVPESKVKTTLFLSNKSTQNSVKIEEFDLLFGIPGLTFKRKDTETDRVKTDVNVIRPGEQCAYELTFKPTSIGITEAIFVVKCQSSEGETENEEEKENEKKKKKKNSNNKNKHGATCQVFATRWCCETVHPKYKGELALLSSQSPSSGILKSPTKKKMNMREQMAKRRAEDLDNLSKIIFNEENIVNSGFRVPGEYRRLASFVDEAVRFEMLEGLEHPGVVQQGLAHSFDRKGGIQSELEKYNDYWHRVLWMEEVLKEKDVKKFDLRNVRIQMLEEKEEVDVDNVLFRVAFPSHDDDTGAGNHPLKGVERAAVESVADGETAVALVTALRDDHLVLKVGNDFLEPKRQQGKFNIRFVLGRVVLERFHEAIHFATNDRRGIELLLRWFLHKKTNMSSRLAAAVPTHDLEVIGGTALNQRQQLAVQCALTFSGPTVPAAANHPYVIFGPPGTGKTTTLVEYILQVLQQEHTTQGQITGKSYRVLVTAPSNSAADNIAMQLLNHVDPTVILRVNASSREIDSLPDELGPICLTKAGKFRRPNWNEITGAKILVMTCCSAANLRKKYSNLCLQHNTFTHCVIDEAGQATEPETLCSVMGLLTRESALILGGDPQQLRPVVLTSFGGRKDGLGLTLLERLTDGEIAPSSPFAVDSHGQTNVEYTTMLVENYRSHESIIKAPNETLYYGELIAKGDQKIVKLNKSQSNSCAILWHGIVAKERREQGNPSFFNPFEIIQVLDYCLRIHREKKVPQEEIGVITPYKKQQLKILRLLKAKGLEEIEVGTVELFQGREKRVIVACCCRSKPVYLDLNKRKDLGFLTDFRRWNVTVTRAKELLVVVANPDLMVHDPYWRDLLHLCACSGNCMGFKPEEIHSSSETFQRAFLHRLERLGLGSVADIHSHVLRIKLDTLLEKDMKKTKSKKSGRKKKEREKQQLVLAAMLNLSPANLVCLCGKKFVEKSNHHYVKDQGGMQHFIQSYGLKPTPDGFDQGNAIIDAIRAIERESFLQEHKHCHLTHMVQEPAFEPLDL